PASSARLQQSSTRRNAETKNAARRSTDNIGQMPAPKGLGHGAGGKPSRRTGATLLNACDDVGAPGAPMHHVKWDCFVWPIDLDCGKPPPLVRSSLDLGRRRAAPGGSNTTRVRRADERGLRYKAYVTTTPRRCSSLDLELWNELTSHG